MSLNLYLKTLNILLSRQFKILIKTHTLANKNCYSLYSEGLPRSFKLLVFATRTLLKSDSGNLQVQGNPNQPHVLISHHN